MFDSDSWISGPKILKLSSMILFVSASLQPFLNVNYYLALFTFGVARDLWHMQILIKRSLLEVHKLNINIRQLLS